MTPRTRWAAALAATLTLAPGTAHAHLVETRLGDFYGGALHPLTDLGQVLPWVTLAGLAAFQGTTKARWIIPAFPLALLAGGIASQLLPSLPVAPVAGIALIAVTGLCLAAALELPLAALLAITGIMGLLHGYENGAAMVATTDRLLFLSGVTAVGYAVLTLAIGSALAFLRGVGDWRPIALRAGGSWVAAAGIMVFGLQLAMPAAQ